MKVSKLHLKNIGPFEETAFDFTVKDENPNIHIITGPNGSGKTSVLHAIASCFDFFENDHKEHLSNLFYKRFKKFKDDKRGMAESYAHAVIRSVKDDKVVDKIAVYGCKVCGNIHQNFEKTVNNKDIISKNGKNYQWQPHSKKLESYRRSILSKSISNNKYDFAVFGYSGYRLVTSAPISIDSDKEFNPLHLALEFVKDKKTGYLISNWMVSRFSKAAIEKGKGNEKLANKYLQGVECLQSMLQELTNNQLKFEIKTSPWKVVILFNNLEVEFDVLPDGLKSLLSWLGDLLMRLDEIPWVNDIIPINEQNLILLLDEIEVHLHPKWQYFILPLTQKLFPNAQIILSTHSPFVVNSIDNAKIHVLTTGNGISKLKKIILSNSGDSYSKVFDTILETHNTFGLDTIKKLEKYNELEKEILKKNFEREKEFINAVNLLKEEGDEVLDILNSKIRRVNRIVGKDYLNGDSN